MVIKRFEKLEQVHDFGGGGGGGSSTTITRYYYLVINGPATTLKDEDVQDFFRKGVETPDEAFVFVNIASDARLEHRLNALPNGPELFAKIKEQAPVFITTKVRIPELTDVSGVEVRQIKNYAEDAVYMSRALIQVNKENKTVERLRTFNKIAHLKPNLFGVGFNLNELIEEIIKKMEGKSPPAK
jgi:hypothetical protein